MGSFSLLRHAGQELGAVGRVADQGWTNEIAGRALAATRVAAACALGRPVSQRPVNASAPGGEGRVVARGLFGRGRATQLSSGVTHEDVSRAIARLPVAANPTRRQTLEQLQTALAAFGQFQYGRDAAADRSALDGALSAASAATAQLRSEAMWPRSYIRRFWMGPVQPEHQT
jgi:hypothetical protein